MNYVNNFAVIISIAAFLIFIVIGNKVYIDRAESKFQQAMIEADKAYQAVIEIRPEIKAVRCVKVALACDYHYATYKGE